MEEVIERPAVAPQVRRLSPAGQFLAVLATGHKPTAKELKELAYALHAAQADCLEMQWMPVTFEDVGDAMVMAEKAMTWCGVKS